jgi:hypothetical protein
MRVSAQAADAQRAPGAAQQAPVAQGGVAPQPDAAAATTSAESAAPAPDTSATLAEESYQAAFEALARGEHSLATQLLQGLVATAPQHPLAARARSVLSALAATATRVQEPTEPPPAETTAAETQTTRRGAQRPTAAARAELVFFQTVHGLTLGAEVCAMASCTGSQPWVLSLMLGAGGGFGLSFYASHGGVTPGLARALTDGTLWGALNGLGLLEATGASNGDQHAVRTGAYLALGQLAGLGVGGLLYHQLEPTAGQVSLSASGGMWSLAVGAELFGMFNPKFGTRTWAALLMGAGNAGVLAGGLLARSVPMTASRVMLIDAGGLLGGLGGLGIAVLAQGDHAQITPTLGCGLLGTLTGLSLSYYLTRDWDKSENRDGVHPTLGVQPVPGGMLAQVSGRW